MLTVLFRPIYYMHIIFFILILKIDLESENIIQIFPKFYYKLKKIIKTFNLDCLFKKIHLRVDL